MSAKKKNRATEKTKQEEMPERFLQSLKDHSKRWWREMYQEYRNRHPKKYPENSF